LTNQTTNTMDLNQRKLTKSEWDAIEEPVSQEEKSILKLIIDGYNDVCIKYNKHNSLFTFLKIEYSKSMEDFLYNRFFSEKIGALISKYEADYLQVSVKSKITINKADTIRIERNDLTTLSADTVYELLLIDYVEQVLKNKKRNNDKWLNAYFTLYKLLRNSVPHINANIATICTRLLAHFEDEINYSKIVANATEFIERNSCLLKYEDNALYVHQKEIYTAMKSPDPKLVLYIAPTGTGKTLTPIGLAGAHKIIFICAARHVGIALARAAISMNKKVAFAFGCMSADDIRLHYYAAKEFTVNKRTGGIRKVDNSVGDKVEIMICDIQSYIYAMYYMLAFNSKNDVITYWDEPTITFDYDTHPFHEIIKRNWKENIIPNMVLSSATLPKLHELTETVSDFTRKFPGSTVQNIVSHDCRKSIPIINNDGFTVMPHLMSQDYEEILKIATHCDDYKTILRYFDLEEASKFIEYVDSNDFIPRNLKIQRQFGSLDDVTMQNIKLHYLKVLKSILSGTWGAVYNHFRASRQRKIMPNSTIDPKGNKIRKAQSIGPGISGSTGPSGGGGGVLSGGGGGVLSGAKLSRMSSVQDALPQPSVPVITGIYQEQAPGASAVYVTTKDAYTLTDGPTIFLAEDVEKIAKFCIQQANIPAKIMEDIMNKIDHNNIVNMKLEQLEKALEDLLEENKGDSSNDKGSKKGGKDNDKKMDRSINNEATNEKAGGVGVAKLREQIEYLRVMIRPASLNNTFVPNKPEHLEKWAQEMRAKNVFTSDIEEETIIKIMTLTGVEDSWKILLLMGVGVFTNHKNIAYTEIMKALADKQKLFLIISSSDYIYGTNYQFCHGYISKDLKMTQEKIIQAMGRIGRSNVQQNYSVRCRDDEHIVKLFMPDAEKPEVINMNILFNSKRVKYEGDAYVEMEEFTATQGEEEIELLSA